MPVLPAILPLLILNNGYTYLAAALLITAYNITSSFTQPVLGWLSDTKGIAVHVSISLPFQRSLFPSWASPATTT
jgi:FSR family fosmidomycin resistance protein-like MFS transporter